MTVGAPRPRSRGGRLAIVVAVIGAIGAGFVFAPPVPQDPAYHNFADTRIWQGIPRVGDVVSSLAFVLVGLLGIRFVTNMVPADRAQTIPGLVFFFGLVLVGVASATYHQEPSTDRLFWDRLAMGIPAAALLAIFVVERIDRRAGLALLPLLLAASAVGALHWRLTEAAGAGDLRLYAFTQIAPVVAIILIAALYPGRHRDGAFVASMVGLYAVGRAFEIFDHEVFAVLGQAVSGHTLKHLTLAGVAYIVLVMLRAHRAAAPGR